MKTCPICNTQHERKSEYCSDTCYNKYRYNKPQRQEYRKKNRKVIPPRKCEYCGKEFIPDKHNGSRQKFCTYTCKTYQWNKDHPEQHKQNVKTWQQENKEIITAKRKIYEAAHKEEKAEYNRHWNTKHVDKNENNRLLRKYGITLAQYNEILESQAGVCACCGKTPEENGKALAVDHIHGSKPIVIRGILCDSCNTSLGKLNDNSQTLRNLADYLDKHKQ